MSKKLLKFGCASLCGCVPRPEESYILWKGSSRKDDYHIDFIYRQRKFFFLDLWYAVPAGWCDLKTIPSGETPGMKAYGPSATSGRAFYIPAENMVKNLLDLTDEMDGAKEIGEYNFFYLERVYKDGGYLAWGRMGDKGVYIVKEREGGYRYVPFERAKITVIYDPNELCVMPGYPCGEVWIHVTPEDAKRMFPRWDGA